MIEPATPEGYRCEGTHYIVAWSFARGVGIFVARSSGRGRRWLRFVRKIGAEGWWVTGYDTLREARNYTVLNPRCRVVEPDRESCSQ